MTVLYHWDKKSDEVVSIPLTTANVDFCVENMRNHEYRVAFDRHEKVEIITSFIGACTYPNEHKSFFETYILGGEHDGVFDQYETAARAREGHAGAVKKVKGD